MSVHPDADPLRRHPAASLSSPISTSCFLPSLPLPHRRRRRCLPVPKVAAFPPPSRAALLQHQPPLPLEPTLHLRVRLLPRLPLAAAPVHRLPHHPNRRPAGLQAPDPAERHPPAPIPSSPPFPDPPRARPLRVLLLRRRRLRQAAHAAPPPRRRAGGPGQRHLDAGAHLRLLPLPRGEGPAAQGVRRVGQHGAGKALEGLPPRHRGLDRGAPAARHRQPPEARVCEPGRDQAVLPRRGAALRPERRTPDVAPSQRPAESWLLEFCLSQYYPLMEKRTQEYQIGIRYAGDARMALALSLKFSAVPIVVPVWVRDFDIDGELWVKLRLIPTEPWVGAASWAFMSLPKIKFELSLFRLFNLMAIPVLSIFLTKLLTEHLPRLFVRPKKIVLDFEKGRAMGPVAGDATSDIIQNVASGIMQGVATELTQDGNKDFVGELSVTLVDARKLSFVLFGKTDPYVAMILGDQVIKSKKNSQTTVTGLPEEPIWNQDFHMLVANPRKQKLCIQVKDSVGLTDITIGTGEVDLSSLRDTVPTDKIVTLYGGWGFFGKRSSGEVVLRLTYKAYVEDEEDEGVKTEYATGYISDEDVLDYVRIDGGAKQPGDFSGNERETFMDLLAALLVSEEFQGIVLSAETRSSREGSEQADEANAGDGVTAGKTIVVDEGTVPSSSEDRALVWLAAITSVMLLVSLLQHWWLRLLQPLA